MTMHLSKLTKLYTKKGTKYLLYVKYNLNLTLKDQQIIKHRD